MVGIEADAGPVHAAAGARVEQRAAQARRREDAVVAQRRAAARGTSASRAAIGVPQIAPRRAAAAAAAAARSETAASARRARRGDRTPAPAAPRPGTAARRWRGRARRRSRPWSPGRPRRPAPHRAAIAHQHRRRGQVVVPQIVVHGLEVPHPLAGGGAQRDDRVREQVGAGAIGAVEVRARRAHRQEDEPALEIGGDRRPHVGGAGVAPAVVLPGVVADLARPRNGVEGPQQAAVARVVGAHVARRRDAPQRVGDRGADHDDVADHRRRRGDVVLPRVDDRRQAGEQVDRAARDRTRRTARRSRRRARSAARRACRERPAARTGLPGSGPRQ